MTKEKAIMELTTNAKQIEALETCIKILEGWTTLEDLTAPLKEKQVRLEELNESLCNIAIGGEFDVNKAF